MKTLCTAGLIVTAIIVAGCAQEPVRTNQVSDQMVGEMDKAAQRAKPRESDAVNQALLPPLRMELPQAQGKPVEGRFDLNVNNAPAREVFLSIVSGTRYSMLVHPEVSGSISVNLKDVSLSEALEAIREIYGYEYKIDGSRVYIEPAGLRTRVFQVNYLIGARQGRSDMRVTAGSSGIATSTTTISSAAGLQQSVTTSTATPVVPGGVQGPPSLTPNAGGALGGASGDATRMSTVQLTDFWAEVAYAIRTIVGSGEGRNIVISPQSGVVVVRAMPQELRSVEALLKAMKLSVERQVMLEAKIIDVTLNKGYQSGINWAGFPTSGIAAGFSNNQASANSSALSPNGQLSAISPGAPSAGPATSSSFFANAAAKTLSGVSGSAGGVFGLAVQTKNFAAMLQFLEAQGTVQVLSSPRVATLNNQKAVLKIGTDQPFVTSITPGTPTTVINPLTGASTTATTFAPTISNIFAGISLDVTPQIDESGNIILHIHPLVTAVSGTPLTFNLGAGDQSITVAKIDVSESDTMVRTSDGNIVVLGGLMKVQLDNSRNGIPGLADVPLIGGAFRNSATGTTKRELVILIKPTIIETDKDWERDILDARGRMQNIGDGSEYRPADRRQ
jgi:MSHA biogenesis protein MshL